MSFKELPCWAKITAAAIFLIFFLNRPQNSGEWASWVQALGSIGAIVGSYSIGSRLAKKESELAIEREEKTKRDRQQGYLSLISLAEQIGKEVISTLSEKKNPITYLRDFLWIGDCQYRAVAVEGALKSVPLSELPSGLQITSLIRVSGALSRLIYLIDAVPSADDVSPEEQNGEQSTIYNAAVQLVALSNQMSNPT